MATYHLPGYPFAERVPKGTGGASCATCKFLEEGLCTNVFYKSYWQADGVLKDAQGDAPPDEFCCMAWTGSESDRSGP